MLRSSHTARARIDTPANTPPVNWRLWATRTLRIILRASRGGWKPGFRWKRQHRNSRDLSCFPLTTVRNQRMAKCRRMWQAGLMANSKLTAREKSRQERERAKSLENRSRQLMRKAAQLQENSRREDIRQAAAGIAKQVIEGK